MTPRFGSRRYSANSDSTRMHSARPEVVGSHSVLKPAFDGQFRPIVLSRRLPGTVEEVWEFLAERGWRVLFEPNACGDGEAPGGMLLEYDRPTTWSMLWRHRSPIGGDNRDVTVIVTVELRQQGPNVDLALSIAPSRDLANQGARYDA